MNVRILDLVAVAQHKVNDIRVVLNIAHECAVFRVRKRHRDAAGRFFQTNDERCIHFFVFGILKDESAENVVARFRKPANIDAQPPQGDDGVGDTTRHDVEVLAVQIGSKFWLAINITKDHVAGIIPRNQDVVLLHCAVLYVGALC